MDDCFQPPEDLSILKLEKELRTYVDALNKEKHKRLGQLKQLKEHDQHLCDIMCTTPYYIPSGAIPTKEQLKELDRHVEELKQEQVEADFHFMSMFHGIFWLFQQVMLTLCLFTNLFTVTGEESTRFPVN